MTPTNADLTRAGYEVRRCDQADGWGLPAGDWILTKPDGKQAVAMVEESLWEVARAHYRRSQIDA